MASAAGARKGAIWGQGQLEEGQRRQDELLTSGFNESKGYLGQAKDLYAGMTQQGQPGLQRYQDLTTGDGAAASAALGQTPGYQFSFDQGLQALNRRRAAGGMLNSGNADADAISFGSGLASQTLGQERQALLPLLGLYSQGAQGQAGTLGSLAGLSTDYSTNRASIDDSTTKSIVGLGTEAFKAGDAAKSANQAMLLSGINAGVGLLGSFAGGPGVGAGGLFTKLFGGR